MKTKQANNFKKIVTALIQSLQQWMENKKTHQVEMR